MSYNVPEQVLDGVTVKAFNFDSYTGKCKPQGDSLRFEVINGYYSAYNTYIPTLFICASSSSDNFTLGTSSLTSYTYDGKTVYFVEYGYDASWFTPAININNSEIEYQNNSVNGRKRAAWLMVYGGYSGYTVTYDCVGCSGDVNNPSMIAPDATVTSMQFNLDPGYAFNSGSSYIDGDGFISGTPIEYIFNTETGALRVGVITSDIVVHVHAYIDPYNDPNNPDLIDGESDIPGGDSIPIPSLPSLSAVTSGIIGLFNPTISQMQLLSDYMWTDFGGTGSTTEDILKEIVQAIKRSISNPLDYVIGLNIIPSAGLSVGASTIIRFGFMNSNVSMPRLTSQFFVVDCGTLSFNALCGDTFLDYAPYAKFSIYLPYIGVKDVDANDFVGHTIGVVYHGDVVTGGITAYITKDGSVMYQYSGCCALNIPLTADNWGNTISGAVQIATALIAGGITGGSAGVASSAVKSVSSVAANPSLLSPQVSRSGAVSGGAGCMAVQKPFVIREAVRFHSTSGFNTVSGYPSYYFKSLSEMHGYTVCYDVHLMGIPATDNEIVETERLLKEGVIL